MSFDFYTTLLSLLFGAVGFGFLLYGKNAGQLIPMGAGVALMVFPYFLPNVAAMLIVCTILTAVPFVFRGG